MKVIVLGLGSMGAAACSHLARRGVQVLGLDQFDPPHECGSHHGESRMIRQAYFEHPDYVPLLMRAYTLWRELEGRSGHALLEETGGLYLGPVDTEIISGSLHSARAHDLPHELLDHAALRDRFPQFRVPDHFVGFFEKHAGYLRPEEAVRAHLAEARGHGADLRSHQRVESWITTTAGIEVRTKSGTHHADRLVITAGAWAEPLLKELGVPLTVTRQVQAWFHPKENPSDFSAGRFPCWFVESDRPFGHYGFPSVNDSGLIKLALHKAGEEVRPLDLPNHPPRPEEVASLHHFLSETIPGAAGEMADCKSCLYTNSPDQHFLVDLHPEDPKVSFATGFSGHGFKFSSVMGEALADLALEGSTALPIEFLSPKRFC